MFWRTTGGWPRLRDQLPTRVSLSEWERLAVPEDRVPHQRSKGPASNPGTRLNELAREVAHTRRALGEAVAEVKRLQRDYERYHSFRGTSFGGVSMAQYQCDLVLWEAILNENADLRFIIELGTWMGGFSWWLWAQAEARGMEFQTYDAVQHNEYPPPGFLKKDVFAASEDLILGFNACEPLILLCDNDNKAREIQTFGVALKDPRSLIVVHDWGTEIGPGDIPDTVEPVYEDYCDALGSISRVFRKRRDA